MCNFAKGSMTLALFAAGTAHAGIPLLNVSCTDKYEVHADEGGPVFINGNSPFKVG
jgi:hypothetical protein